MYSRSYNAQKYEKICWNYWCINGSFNIWLINKTTKKVTDQTRDIHSRIVYKKIKWEYSSIQSIVRLYLHRDQRSYWIFWREIQINIFNSLQSFIRWTNLEKALTKIGLNIMKHQFPISNHEYSRNIEQKEHFNLDLKILEIVVNNITEILHKNGYPRKTLEIAEKQVI